MLLSGGRQSTKRSNPPGCAMRRLQDLRRAMLRAMRFCSGEDRRYRPERRYMRG